MSLHTSNTTTSGIEIVPNKPLLVNEWDGNLFITHLRDLIKPTPDSSDHTYSIFKIYAERILKSGSMYPDIDTMFESYEGICKIVYIPHMVKDHQDKEFLFPALTDLIKLYDTAHRGEIKESKARRKWGKYKKIVVRLEQVLKEIPGFLPLDYISTSGSMVWGEPQSNALRTLLRYLSEEHINLWRTHGYKGNFVDKETEKSNRFISCSRFHELSEENWLEILLPRLKNRMFEDGVIVKLLDLDEMNTENSSVVFNDKSLPLNDDRKKMEKKQKDIGKETKYYPTCTLEKTLDNLLEAQEKLLHLQQNVNMLLKEGHKRQRMLTLKRKATSDIPRSAKKATSSEHSSSSVADDTTHTLFEIDEGSSTKRHCLKKAISSDDKIPESKEDDSLQAFLARSAIFTIKCGEMFSCLKK